jgi:predicted dehydrogenase
VTQYRVCARFDSSQTSQSWIRYCGQHRAMGSISQAAITAKPRFVVIGGGSRGSAYGRAVQASTNGQIAAIAEINPFVREEFGQKYIWGERKRADHESFPSWEAWLDWEQARRKNPSIVADPDYVPVTGAFICTLDESHVHIIKAIAPLNLHILCEKPLALSLKDCLDISTALAEHPTKIASIGHVLRYSPHNIVLRALLLEQQAIGEIVSIEHTEPIGWWHFSHSYVRGNWRHVKPDGVGSLLTKSCHDIDFLMWLLTSPSSLTGEKPHLPTTITSTGHMTQFRKSRKPQRAGNATNCLSCPAADECSYAAQKLYRDHWLRKERDTGWPLKIVVPEIEDIVAKSGWDGAETKLMSRLSEDYDAATPSSEVEKRGWYGRCVYESDNSVVDDQTVVIGWEEDPISGTPSENGYGRGPKTAVFHMTAPTEAQCDRRGSIYGSQGEISYDSKSISVYTFADRKTNTHVIPKQAPEVEKAHGGGDWGLAGAFVRAVEEVDNGTLEVGEAQWRYVGCDLQEIIRSHGVVFAAEEARNKRAVVDWKDFCSRTGCPV